MRRFSVLATFVLLAFFVQISHIPALAQHGGGGHGGGGSHGGGFSGGHGGGFGGGHSSFSGGHSGFSTSSPSVHAYSGPLSRGYTPRYAAPSRSYSSGRAFHPPSSSASRIGSWQPLGSWTRFSGNRSPGNRRGGVGITIRSRGYYGPWRYGYSGWYGYYDPYWYDPYWLWDSSSYDDDQNNYVDGQYDGQYQDYAQGNPNEQNLEAESDRENAQQDYYARSQPREPLHAELTAPSPPTTLVFRDQHKEEIQNYAIIGHTLWNFSDQRTQKIPLADLDIPATQKENEGHGVDFRLPVGDQIQ